MVKKRQIWYSGISGVRHRLTREMLSILLRIKNMGVYHQEKRSPYCL
ncbi:hypothetical protein [Calothrix sp. NIES-2100]